MTRMTTYLPILTLNVNGLNSPMKRHCLANWIKKVETTICCIQETQSLTETSTGLGEKAEQPQKKGMSSNNYLRQRKLQTYIDQMR
jgi:exonuclease III